ncbi:MAG: Methionine aminopeptidase [Parcubacteria group bacterium GW2011_GWA2_45_30]|nr:MAG: Methionine aminopeptidase [Parcubacteria group bacterium GW2011_GWA2_45_30]
MITIKTKEEIEILREGGKYLAEILQKVVAAVKPGVSTLELDGLAEGLILDCGGKPAFKGYRIKEVHTPFPGTICTSINDEVVHGIPQKNRVLKEGDIIGIDIGMAWPADKYQVSSIKYQGRGLFTDMAVTIGIGKISAEAERLIRITQEALDMGIQAVKPGAHTGDIGTAVESHLKKNKLGIIRDLAGHGVGHELHEEPLIPNFGKKGAGTELREGMVIAIEPMATLGDWRIKLDRDEWTIHTADQSSAAHFEHTVAVMKDGAEVLTR